MILGFIYTNIDNIVKISNVVIPTWLNRSLLRREIDDAYDEFSHWFISKETSPEDKVSENELKMLLKKALKSLEEKEAIVIQLYFV